MNVVWNIVIFLLLAMLAACEIFRWYRKGYEEGLEKGKKVGHNEAVQEMMEKLK